MKEDMKARRLSFFWVLSIFCSGTIFSGHGLAQEEQLLIKKYRTDSLAVYNAKGHYQYDVKASDLPTPEIVVSEHQNFPLIKLSTEDGEFWISKSAVKLSAVKTTNIACDSNRISIKSADHKTASTIGLSKVCE